MDCLLSMSSTSRGNGVPRTVEAETAAKATIAKSRDMLVLKRIPVWPEHKTAHRELRGVELV